MGNPVYCFNWEYYTINYNWNFFLNQLTFSTIIIILIIYNLLIPYIVSYPLSLRYYFKKGFKDYSKLAWRNLLLVYLIYIAYIIIGIIIFLIYYENSWLSRSFP